MKNVIKFLKEKILHIGALVLGATALSSYALPHLSEHTGDTAGFDDSEFEENTPKEISNQIDENEQKLRALENKDNSNSTDYRLLGC